MKRRVTRKIRHREPGMVGTGTEGFGEDGLGAAHRLPFGIGCDGSARQRAGV